MKPPVPELKAGNDLGHGLRLFVLLGLLLLALLANAIAGSGVWAWTGTLLWLAADTAMILYMLASARRGLAEDRRAPALTAGPGIGVIVPGCNEREAMPRTIDSLLQQEPEPAELLVVDDGSSDGMAEDLIDRYALVADGDDCWRSTRWPCLRLLRQPNRGKATALNRGLAMLDTPVVATIDADTVLMPGALAALSGAFADPEVQVACAVLEPRCAAPWLQLQQRHEYMRSFLWRRAWVRHGSLALVSGACAAFRREALLAVDGFDQQSWVEDYDVLYRLHRWHRIAHGFALPVRVVPQAVASTDAPAGLAAFIRQRRRWFGGFVATLLRHRDMIGSPRFGLFGTFHLRIKVLDALQPYYQAGVLAILLGVVAGRGLPPLLLGVLAGKHLLDVACHTWAAASYARWLGRPFGLRPLLAALVAHLVEPLGFQPLRTFGALSGWWAMLRGRCGHGWTVAIPEPMHSAGKATPC